LNSDNNFDIYIIIIEFPINPSHVRASDPPHDLIWVATRGWKPPL